MRKDENTKTVKYQFEELSNQIIGAAIRVHKELWPTPILSQSYWHESRVAAKFLEAHIRGQESSQLNFPFSYFRAFVIQD